MVISTIARIRLFLQSILFARWLLTMSMCYMLVVFGRSVAPGMVMRILGILCRLPLAIAVVVGMVGM